MPDAARRPHPETSISVPEFLPESAKAYWVTCIVTCNKTFGFEWYQVPSRVWKKQVDELDELLYEIVEYLDDTAVPQQARLYLQDIIGIASERCRASLKARENHQSDKSKWYYIAEQPYATGDWEVFALSNSEYGKALLSEMYADGRLMASSDDGVAAKLVEEGEMEMEVALKCALESSDGQAQTKPAAEVAEDLKAKEVPCRSEMDASAVPSSLPGELSSVQEPRPDLRKRSAGGAAELQVVPRKRERSPSGQNQNQSASKKATAENLAAKDSRQVPSGPKLSRDASPPRRRNASAASSRPFRCAASALEASAVVHRTIILDLENEVAEKMKKIERHKAGLKEIEKMKASIADQCRSEKE